MLYPEIVIFLPGTRFWFSRLRRYGGHSGKKRVSCTPKRTKQPNPSQTPTCAPTWFTHNSIDLVHREKIRNISRSQQVVDIDQESLVGYLAVGEQKHEAFVLVPSLIKHFHEGASARTLWLGRIQQPCLLNARHGYPESVDFGPVAPAPFIDNFNMWFRWLPNTRHELGRRVSVALSLTLVITPHEPCYTWS